jgi:hypothetical protein
MLRERRRTKAAATVTDDPAHDDDAPAGRSGSRESAARRPRPKVERPFVPPLPPNVFASVAGLLRGPHHFANEALWSLGALVAMTDAAGARIEVIVPRGHGRKRARRSRGWRLRH